MKQTQLYIRGMCCDRCIDKVRQLLGEGNFKPLKTTLGEVHLASAPTGKELKTLNRKLETKGFTLVNSHREKIVNRIKAATFQYMDDLMSKDIKTKFSDFVVKKVGISYYYISRIFSATENITLKKFLILLKIEKTKEMLVQNEFTTGEIAYRLGYSSSQSLSAQFKGIIGKTPGQYKLNPLPGRVNFDKITEQNIIQTS